MLLADYQAYVDTQDRVNVTYRDPRLRLHVRRVVGHQHVGVVAEQLVDDGPEALAIAAGERA